MRLASSLLMVTCALCACNDVDLVDRPARPPVAVLEGSTTTPNTLETVALDGRNSYDPDGGSIVDWQFVVSEQPLGSAAVVDGLDAGRASVFVDVAGHYTVTLVVVDDEGTASLPTAFSFDAIAFEDIHVELSWNTDATDVDLHLVNQTRCPTGTCFAAQPYDCFWNNPSPDWGPQGSVGDPTLDLDDLYGYGPENINISEPETDPQIYVVQVNYYQTRDNGPSTATVRIYLDGELHYEDSATLPDRGYTWSVAQISWPDAHITPLDTVFDSGYPH